MLTEIYLENVCHLLRVVVHLDEEINACPAKLFYREDISHTKKPFRCFSIRHNLGFSLFAKDHKLRKQAQFQKIFIFLFLENCHYIMQHVANLCLMELLHLTQFPQL